MLVSPSAALHQEFDRLFDLLLVGITLLNDADRNAMSAEDQFSSSRLREVAEGFLDLLDQGVKIARITVERLDRVDRKLVAEEPVPLVQAASRGRASPAEMPGTGEG